MHILNRLYRFLSGWIFCHLAAALLSGCVSERGVTVEPDVEEFGRKILNGSASSPPLFEVMYEGRTSYLLGTMHVGLSAGKLPARIMFKLADSKTAFFETIQERRSFPFKPIPKQDLKSVLSSKAWGTLKQRTRWKDERLKGLTPGQALAILKIIELENVASAKGSSLDNELEQEARQRGIPLRGLDTEELLEKALSAFVIPAEALNSLLESDVYYNNFLRALYQMANDYQRGGQSFVKIGEKHGADFDALLRSRNLAWAETLTPALREGGAFVAVGAAHLFGKESLVELLVARGFKVSAL